MEQISMLLLVSESLIKYCLNQIKQYVKLFRERNNRLRSLAIFCVKCK